MLLTELTPICRPVMTDSNVSFSFQNALSLPHEIGRILILSRSFSGIRGKRFAIEVGHQFRYFYIMKTENNNEVLTSPPESIIVTSVGVLKSAFLQWNEEQIQAREAMKEEVMLDEVEVLERLDKSHATLWRWNNSGYLPRYKLGGKNRYKESDVLRIMKAQEIRIGSTKLASDGYSSPPED